MIFCVQSCRYIILYYINTHRAWYSLRSAPVTCTPHCLLFFFFTRTASDANRIPIMYTMAVTFHTLGRRLNTYNRARICICLSISRRRIMEIKVIIIIITTTRNEEWNARTGRIVYRYIRSEPGLMGCARLVVGNNRVCIILCIQWTASGAAQTTAIDHRVMRLKYYIVAHESLLQRPHSNNIIIIKNK